ncbi:MAG: hypothetical protein AMXMBFR61_04190 [Fimbriimonadales bacterium]
MFIDLINVLKQISARSDYDPGTPVYLDTRPQGLEPRPEVAKRDEWLCENGMKLVVEFDGQGRVLGIQVWPIPD